MSNKELIIEIATNLFSQKGYEAVGIQEIVDEAKVTKPTLYHYFGNKRGLLDSIFEKNYSVFIDNFREASNYNGDIVLSLTKIFTFYINFAKNNTDFFRLAVASLFSPRSSEIYEAGSIYMKKINELIVNMFEAATANHGNIKGHQELFAISLLGLLNHYALSAVNEQLEITDDFIYKAVKHFMHGIYAL